MNLEDRRLSSWNFIRSDELPKRELSKGFGIGQEQSGQRQSDKGESDICSLVFSNKQVLQSEHLQLSSKSSSELQNEQRGKLET